MRTCKLSDAEADFYHALYASSRARFDTFVARGTVLHNYGDALVC